MPHVRTRSNFTTQCILVQSPVLRSHVVRLSVRLSVTLVDCDHIGWKSWKLIAQTISPTPSFFVAKRLTTSCTLHPLLPPPFTASQNYNLRHRTHSLQLPGHATHLMDCTFIIPACFIKMHTTSLTLGLTLTDYLLFLPRNAL